MSDYEHIIDGCSPHVSLTLNTDEIRAVLKAHDYGIYALNAKQLESLHIILAKMKDQVWP
ncbi:MAG: hypothetical protein GX772_05715 [Alcaligenaceae bacterium]|nr:hypothetical protein [Alcaligenaceae bacterium]